MLQSTCAQVSADLSSMNDEELTSTISTSMTEYDEMKASAGEDEVAVSLLVSTARAAKLCLTDASQAFMARRWTLCKSSDEPLGLVNCHFDQYYTSGGGATVERTPREALAKVGRYPLTQATINPRRN